MIVVYGKADTQRGRRVGEATRGSSGSQPLHPTTRGLMDPRLPSRRSRRVGREGTSRRGRPGRGCAGDP